MVAVNLLSPKREAKANASWVNHYTGIKTLADESDFVIIGEVVDSVPEKRIDMIFTMQSDKIEKYISGGCQQRCGDGRI